MRFFALIAALSTVVLLDACQTSDAPSPEKITYNRRVPARRGYRAPAVHTQAPIPKAATTAYKAGTDTALLPVRPLARPTTPPPTPNCAAVCVIDPRTGRVLYSHNGDQRRQVGSTQKIITALCVCDEKRLNKMVTIQKSDLTAPPVRMNLKAGTSYRKGDLLQAMLTGSYNDVALALARDTAGSVDAFVARMNARARYMRMHNTHFANPNGLPAAQYSTANDMALAACYAYTNPIIRSCINVPEYAFTKADGTVRMVHSTNRLLGQYPWVQGMKTGYTHAAGKCLISCGTNNGRAVIVVVLGSTNTRVWGESLKYLKWALGRA